MPFILFDVLLLPSFAASQIVIDNDVAMSVVALVKEVDVGV